MTDMTNKWCWYQDSDDRFRMCDSAKEAHGEAQCHIDDVCIQGDEAEYIVAKVAHPMDAVGMDWIARNIAETIEENICCWCDDENGAEDYSIELTKEDKETLGKMVAAFVREKASVHWWTPDRETITKCTYFAGSAEAGGMK